MQNRIFFLLLIFLLSMTACEDVIEVDVPEGEPRLVIDAKGVLFENQEQVSFAVRLSKTFPYFDDLPETVNDADISISVNNETFPVEGGQGGTYFFHQLPAVYDTNYTLRIEVEGEVYEGTTQLMPSVPFDYIEQNSNQGFDPDETSINAYFTDPVDERNFYYFEFISEEYGTVYDNIDDELFNGNQVSTYYADEFEPGDTINIRIEGITESFNTYFSILRDQASSGGNPFGTAPAPIRGNMVNLTNEDHYPLGYFRLSQQYSTVYTIQPE